MIKRGLVAPQDSAEIVNEIVIDLAGAPAITRKGYVGLGELLMLDIIATNAAEGWPRPIYWCSTVGDEYYLGMRDYLRSTGMTHQLVPTRQSGIPARADRAYDVVTNYRWGGADKAVAGGTPYFDETARRMLVTTRNSMLDVASELIYQGDRKATAGDDKGAKEEYKKALNTLNLLTRNLSENVTRYDITVAMTLPEIYGELGKKLGDKSLTEKGRDLIWSQMERYIQYVAYQQNIAMTFGGVALTHESRLMPYQYWYLIKVYEDLGGDPKKTDSLLKRYGFNRNDLKAAYDRAYSGGSGGSGEGGAGGYSESDYVNELAEVARIVNELAALPAAEYSARSADDRYYDSIYYDVYQQYLKAGIKQESLDANAEIKKVDMVRSKRLNEEFNSKH